MDVSASHVDFPTVSSDPCTQTISLEGNEKHSNMQLNKCAAHSMNSMSTGVFLVCSCLERVLVANSDGKRLETNCGSDRFEGKTASQICNVKGPVALNHICLMNVDDDENNNSSNNSSSSNSNLHIAPSLNPSITYIF